MADKVFYMIYGAVALLSLVACCYLLLRRGNAFAPQVKSSGRLRRWTAALFAAMTLSHLWYLPMYFLSSRDDLLLSYLIGGLLDCVVVVPLAITVLLQMLQDRHRRAWLVWLAVAPLVVLLAISAANRNLDLFPIFYVYCVLLLAGLAIYMVVAVRQYGRWLRDNYADLENKEVWQSFLVLAVILLVFAIYAFEPGGSAFEYVMQAFNVVIVCYLLWRVETLSDLSLSRHYAEANAESAASRHRHGTEDDAMGHTTSVSNNIEPLLKRHCEEPQLYLQHDISITQLAKLIGINRSYLSKHFALQGITYNAYINGLRISHFVALYREAAASHEPVTARQLAHRSGFRSYSTFSVAFKQLMGMTASEWMRRQGV